MTLTINGEQRSIPSSRITVRELLGQLELVPETVVVELNRSIVPRGRYQEALVKEGDVLEIVRVVGGG